MALIKYGGGIYFGLSGGTFKADVSLLSAIGIICYVTSFILWLSILKQQALSYIYPLTSAISIVAAALLGFVMGETLSVQKITGIILIIIGVIIMG